MRCSASVGCMLKRRRYGRCCEVVKGPYSGHLKALTSILYWSMLPRYESGLRSSRVVWERRPESGSVGLSVMARRGGASLSVTIDSIVLVGIVFSGLPALVIEDVEDPER